MNIAIVGATGNVGRKLIEVLEKKNFPITELFLIASSKLTVDVEITSVILAIDIRLLWVRAQTILTKS